MKIVNNQQVYYQSKINIGKKILAHGCLNTHKEIIESQYITTLITPKIIGVELTMATPNQKPDLTTLQETCPE